MIVRLLWLITASLVLYAFTDYSKSPKEFREIPEAPAVLLNNPIHKEVKHTKVSVDTSRYVTPRNRNSQPKSTPPSEDRKRISNSDDHRKSYQPQGPLAYQNSSGDRIVFDREERKRWFARGEPSQIFRAKDGDSQMFDHPHGGTRAGRGRILYFADQQSVERFRTTLATPKQTSSEHRQKKLNRELSEESSEPQDSESELDVDTPAEDSVTVLENSFEDTSRPRVPSEIENSENEEQCPLAHRIAKTSFKDHSFIPGRMDGRLRHRRVKKPRNLLWRIRFLDFSHALKEGEDSIVRGREVSKTVLSMGHSGELIIEIQEGWILNEEGPDFVVYENPFLIESGPKAGEYYLELTEVAVSHDGQNYTSFPCDVKQPYSPGSRCAGTIPSALGGSPFDLDFINVNKPIRFIRIRDTGKNFNNLSPPKAGADLDAISLLSGCQSQRSLN